VILDNIVELKCALYSLHILSHAFTQKDTVILK